MTLTKSDRPARARRPAETRQAVLTAAAKLFSQASYEGVALDDIASSSGVRKNTLLYHFESKEKLWRETVDYVFATVDQNFAEEIQARDHLAMEGLERFIGVYLEVCRRHPAYVLIPLLEGVVPSWRSDWIADRHLKPHVASFGTYIRGLIGQGVLPPIEPLHLQNILTGGAQIFMAMAPIWERALGLDTRNPGFLDSYAHSLTDIIRRASRPDAPKK